MEVGARDRSGVLGADCDICAGGGAQPGSYHLRVDSWSHLLYGLHERGILPLQGSQKKDIRAHSHLRRPELLLRSSRAHCGTHPTRFLLECDSSWWHHHLLHQTLQIHQPTRRRYLLRRTDGHLDIGSSYLSLNFTQPVLQRRIWSRYCLSIVNPIPISNTISL